MSRELPSVSPKEAFFKTPDLITVGSTIIYPGIASTLSVLADDQTREKVNEVIDKNRLKVSIRSRYAQLGLDMQPEAIAAFIGQLPGSGVARLQLHNHSLRPIQLPEDTRLLRLFHEPADAILTDAKLSQAIGSGKIKLSGARGKDWEWAYDDLGTRMGVFIRIINSNSRRWISSGEEIINIGSEDMDYRAQIDRILEPLPEDGRQALWIGETAIKITLGNSIEGVLDTRVLRDVNYLSLDSIEGTQINSLLIDSGTQWPVRVEVISSTDSNLIPNYVRFHFIQNGHGSS